MSNANTQAITYERGADLIAESQVEDRLDIGHSMVYRLKHPQEGAIVVISSSVGQSAMVRA